MPDPDWYGKSFPDKKSVGVLKDFASGVFVRLESPMINELGFEGSEEAFCGGIIPAVGFAAHATNKVA